MHPLVYARPDDLPMPAIRREGVVRRAVDDGRLSSHLAIQIEDSGGQLWASGGATNGSAWPVYFRLRKNPSHSAQASAGMTTSHTPTDSLRDRQQHQTGMTFSRLFQ